MKKFVAAFREQMSLFRNQYVPFIHGSKLLQTSVKFGSIYLDNTSSFQRGLGMFVTPAVPTEVGRVERELGATADAKYRIQNNR